ncbi:MAG TPA: amino acid ABC transporter permease [Aliidongia sp.]|nr:amino acid ABC transporter permease [Aliidongia sp.]
MVLAQPVRWLRANLFNSVGNALTTLVILYLLYLTVGPFLRWAIFDAVWSAPDMRSCRAAGQGACWAFIGEKWRFILFGRYTYDQQWRCALVTVILCGLTGLSFAPSLWRRELAYVWIAGVAVSAILMFGGVLGLPYVSTDLWSGLPLTLILSLFSMILGFPLAVLLALGRRSELPVIKLLSTAAIEFMRGVPLIAMLYMASLMLPLFLPPGFVIDKQLRALVGITLFLAAYQAEDVRGGLQALPRGQGEAADALGLGYWQKMRLVILPQAITIVIPPLVSNLIGNFKNTSLVSIIGLYDLLEDAIQSLVDPNWRGLTAEAYLFVGAIYFIFCYSMSRYSRWLEARLDRNRRR